VLTFFGFHSVFLTALIPSVNEYNKLEVFGINAQADPREIGSKFYSFQLVFAMILIVIFYSLASILFKDKKKTQRDKEEEKPAAKVKKVVASKTVKKAKEKQTKKVVKKTTKKATKK
jgi:hypothetical protein